MSSTKPIFSMPLHAGNTRAHVEDLGDEINRVIDELWPQSPGGPAGVLDEVNAARSGAEAARDTAEGWADAAEGFRDEAEGFRDEAETARDAAFVNADVYPDIATGRAAVNDGEQFQVVDGDEIIRYRRDSSSTQTEVARYPAGHVVGQLIADHGNHAAVIGQACRDAARIAGSIDQFEKNDVIFSSAMGAISAAVGQIARHIDGSSTSSQQSLTNPAVGGDVVYLPEPEEIATLNFETGSPLPASKGDPAIPGIVTLTIGGETIRCNGTIAVQGSGSSNHFRKNWKLRFFDGSNPLRLQIGKSVPSKSWVFKQDWYDPTTVRSYVCYALWRQMTEARDGLPKFEVDNAWWGKSDVSEGAMTSATGVPVTHPLVMSVNGDHYALGYIMLKDEPQNYNLDPNNPDHIYFEIDALKAPSGGAHPAAYSWKKLSSTAIDADVGNKVGDWILWEFPKWSGMSGAQQTAAKDLIDDLYDVLFTSQQYFDENFEDHFDQMNLIDFLLFIDLIYDYDHLARDIQIVSYDMKKVYFLPWDKDSTFGIKMPEDHIQSPTTNLIDINNFSEFQAPFSRIYAHDPSAVEARYAQLRERGIFSHENVYHLAEQCGRMISPELRRIEFDLWNGIGTPGERNGITVRSTFQIIDWTEQRIAHLDTKYNYSA